MNESGTLTPLGRRDLASVFHPMAQIATLNEQGPLMIVRGEGIYVWDEDGKQYIDGLAGLVHVAQSEGQGSRLNASSDSTATEEGEEGKEALCEQCLEFVWRKPSAKVRRPDRVGLVHGISLTNATVRPTMPAAITHS